MKPARILEADDRALAAALDEAQLATLLVALAHITDDESLLRANLVPDDAFSAGPQGGYDADQIDEA